MAPTLRRVVAHAPLRLRALGDEDLLDRPVRWVAVSELEDPTPFLEGGELVLTTGMRISPETAGSYVTRLVEREVAGLGLGLGLTHETVPAELAEAARHAGLPLIEVPRETAFVAIGKVVSELLAAEQYEELSRAFAVQGRLTRAALRPEGTHAVLRRLVAEIGGWAALLDDAGEVIATAGERAEGRVPALRPELARLRGRHASLTLSTPDEHVIVQALAGAGRVRGYFAVGAAAGERTFSPVRHTVVNVAGSLLTLALEQEARRPAAERRVRAAVLRLLLAGEVDGARAALAALGDPLPEPPVVVLATRGDRDGVIEAAGGTFAAALGEETIVLAPADGQEALVRALGPYGPVGVGEPVGLDRLAAGTEQARRALAAAHRICVPVMRYAALPGQGLLAVLDPGAAQAFATALLAPMLEYGTRADLLESLRAYLEANGHWDAAAQRLGIHRHTLRYRMRKVAELLGRDIDDPATRAELWVACSIIG
ncbi:PucR family transcriptional regulator [Spongiactinospora sp. 9N601]|uniref:PucR family transcriptional regulator n=1 Tax=Spongiactinospora sp. 9N601 TaxID=3375149 RepID=UPI00378C50C7